MCTIGTKIRKLRIDNNLSQPELSKMLDISQSTLCSIESGDRKKIDFSLIQKICLIFNKDLNYFKEVPASLKVDKNVVNFDNNEAVTGVITNIIDQFIILVQDNQNNIKIIQELKNKLKTKTDL
jgi:transcriptional regulator with XRE-family HTH domain